MVCAASSMKRLDDTWEGAGAQGSSLSDPTSPVFNYRSMWGRLLREDRWGLGKGGPTATH